MRQIRKAENAGRRANQVATAIMNPRCDTGTLVRKFYYDLPTFVDGTAEFHRLCGWHIAHGSRILEIGSGPANATTKFPSGFGLVVGADISGEVLTNPWLCEAHVHDGGRLPFGDSTFTSCASNYIVEHIEDPVRHFQEVFRLLVPGGVYCLRTLNLRHCVALASKLLPYSVHRRLANRLRDPCGDASDPYQTAYRANTPRAIRRLCARTGLRISELFLAETEPSHGRASIALFFPMMLYERAVNRFGWLRGVRANILAALEKQALAEARIRC